MLLSVLVTELQSQVPAVNSVPTTAQYEQAIKDAVQDFSRRCGRVKFGELNIVANTATYSLASDFIDLIFLEGMVSADGHIISNAGIIPVSADWEEDYFVYNGQITFKPTPTYTLTRDYKYKAAWLLTGSGGSQEYATLGENEKQIVMIKAKQLAKEKLRNSLGSSGAMSYSLGAVRVDKGGGLEEMTKELFSLAGEYVNACEVYNGSYLAG